MKETTVTTDLTVMIKLTAVTKPIVIKPTVTNAMTGQTAVTGQTVASAVTVVTETGAVTETADAATGQTAADAQAARNQQAVSVGTQETAGRIAARMTEVVEMRDLSKKVRKTIRIIERIPVIIMVIKTVAESVRIARRNLRADQTRI